jgi:hypothetical protein
MRPHDRLKPAVFQLIIAVSRTADCSMISQLSANAMAEPAWIIKWRAREALKNGQPEEAHRLLDGLIASGNRRAFALRADVVRGYLERAERSLRHDDAETAWTDLARVETLADGDGGVVRLREALTRLDIAEIWAGAEGRNEVEREAGNFARNCLVKRVRPGLGHRHRQRRSRRLFVRPRGD